jgi:hypothetical protein
MKKKIFIVITAVIGAVATVCALAGCAIYSCISNFDNVQFLIDNCITEKTEE